MAGPSHEDNERIPRARLAAHALHARITDPSAHRAPARAAFLERFEREVDPDGLPPIQERLGRAEHAKKAYFLKLALASKKVREAKKRRQHRKPDSTSAVPAGRRIPDQLTQQRRRIRCHPVQLSLQTITASVVEQTRDERMAPARWGQQRR